MHSTPVEAELLADTRTHTGETLADLSDQSPILLVLLRHEGCTFCRNAMSDIARLQARIEGVGTRIVLGHMGTEEEFAAFAGRYGLSAISAVADPNRRLYKGLGLRRGRLWQLLGPRVVWTWFKATLAGHILGRVKSDPFQLPGAFLIHHRQVIKAYAYRDAADKPDYVTLATPDRPSSTSAA